MFISGVTTNEVNTMMKTAHRNRVLPLPRPNRQSTTLHKSQTYTPPPLYLHSTISVGFVCVCVFLTLSRRLSQSRSLREQTMELKIILMRFIPTSCVRDFHHRS